MVYRVLLVALTLISVLRINHVSAITVTNTLDSGAGSLRQAIATVSTNAGADTITFNISGAGVHTITPATQLPTITDRVVIDGTTQPGYAGKPLIEISGATVDNGGNCLVVQSGGGGSTLRSLAINHEWSVAIDLQANNVIIEACFLGTDATGISASGNGGGVNAEFGASAARQQRET